MFCFTRMSTFYIMAADPSLSLVTVTAGQAGVCVRS